MFPIFISCCFSAKAFISNKRSFDSLINKNPYSLVLFQTSNCLECKRGLEILDHLTDKYLSSISMIGVDTDVSPEIQQKYNVKKIPSIAIFARQKLLYFYKGDWSEKGINELCESLLSHKVTVLEDIFDIVQFQQTKVPCNLVISDISEIETAKYLLNNFIGTVHVAICRNKSDSQQLGINVAQLTRPYDGFVMNLTDLNISTISENSKNLINRINNQEEFGQETSPNTLVAFVDEHDPYHLYQMRILFNQIASLFPSNLSFQFCDFYKCTNVAKQLGITNYGNVLYVLSTRSTTNPQLSLFSHGTSTFENIKIFLEEKILGIKTETSEIPTLYARNFAKVVMRENKDIILLIAVPGMESYQESKEKVMKMISIFKEYDNIEFYEFNPKSQYVPGLQVPNADEPIIAIWPNSPSASGASFRANIPLSTLVKNIMRNIKTKISPAHVKHIIAQAEKSE
ncbi:thioredoxin [Histomonas meleagridis]|uniref:thioredoxin n=1 Tax=Histomonas meleagridis TaxID=135588 RepID=UPI00355A55C8|nr:thioredoxin [Histomonas meleagridis]KAH0802813.1 thioredoxin [Histomonas meleagridis]